MPSVIDALYVTEDYVEPDDGEADREQKQRPHEQQMRVKRYSSQRQRLPADDLAPLPPPQHPPRPVVMTTGYFPPGTRG